MDKAYFEEKLQDFQNQLQTHAANVNALNGAVQFCNIVLQDMAAKEVETNNESGSGE